MSVRAKKMTNVMHADGDGVTIGYQVGCIMELPPPGTKIWKSFWYHIPWTGSFITGKGIKAYGLNNQSALGVVGIPGTQADAATIVVVLLL